MAHKYEIKLRGKDLEIKGGAPRVALNRALRRLSHRNDDLDLVDFQLKKGESMVIWMKRIE